MLGGGGLDADLIPVAPHHTGQTGFHLFYVGIDFGAFRAHCRIHISHTVAFFGNEFNTLAKDLLTVHIECSLAGIGKMITDVAQVGCTEQGITDGMDEDIGIAVAEQAQRMRNLYAT